MNLRTLLEWRNLEDRREALENFASYTEASVKDDSYVWSHGEFLLLHFDLVTTDTKNKSIDRSAVYRLIGETIASVSGARLSQSVYITPLRHVLESSKVNAAKLWNLLADKTRGQLVEGDIFYLHFAPTQIDQIGGIAAIVKKGKDSLRFATIPSE